MNKSLLTNLVSVGMIAVGYGIQSGTLLAIGYFATSGAITNWLAIYMLFERVPGLYGSGVIPNRFEEFKTGIHQLIMKQFFTRENVENFFNQQATQDATHLDPEPILAVVDYDRMFQRLVDAVLSSPFGGMLGMMGGVKALQPLREPFINNVKEEIRAMVTSPSLQKALTSSLQSGSHTQEIIEKVDSIVIQRLNELTPEMVKEIIQEMIRQHLGWLVVWGGVFGGLIGLASSLFPAA
ncbi:MAG: hypothetical protein KDA91_07610 [Planctomycetaceae bacterium]|nr:hypothetical protein [Planctomycetaceae bacterium]